MKDPIDYKFEALESKARADFWRNVAIMLLVLLIALAVSIKFIL